MNWFFDKKIDIICREGGMIDGIYVSQANTKTKTIDCDVQPIGNDKIYDDTGALIQVQYQIFCAPDKDIHTHSKVNYNNKEYTIAKIVDWDDYWIIYIKGVS